MLELSCMHPVSKSQFRQKVDIVPLCCQQLLHGAGLYGVFPCLICCCKFIYPLLLVQTSPAQGVLFGIRGPAHPGAAIDRFASLGVLCTPATL